VASVVVIAVAPLDLKVPTSLSDVFSISDKLVLSRGNSDIYVGICQRDLGIVSERAKELRGAKEFQDRFG